MSETLARQGIMTALAQAAEQYGDYPLVVESDNRKLVDQTAQTNPYIQITIQFMGAEQADLAANPLVKHTGQILLSVVEREGSGTAAGAALRDFLRPFLSLKNLGIVRTHAAGIYAPKARLGWVYTPILVDFWYHEVS